jgi:5-methylcytosine-specific restriction endonuclease McrA
MNKKIYKRSEAKSLGLKRYYTGKPCPKDHLGDRFVSTGSCCVCIAAKTERWRIANADLIRAYSRYYHWMHREERKLKAKEWREKNPEIQRALSQDWSKRNKERRRVLEQNRRALKARSGGSHTLDQIHSLLKKQGNKCTYCRADVSERYHIDHKTPIALGGSNGIRNLQILCPLCNQRKHKKDHKTFTKQLKQERKQL